MDGGLGVGGSVAIKGRKMQDLWASGKYQVWVPGRGGGRVAVGRFDIRSQRGHSVVMRHLQADEE